jgi:tetratricopeptide (TPR) repeat protein
MSKRMDMSGTWRRWVLVGVIGLIGCRTTGTAVRAEEKPPQQVIEFEAVEITADLELDKLNDAELFAKGTAAYGAEDYKQAARYFGRLADFHPNSPQRTQALYNAGLSHRNLQEWEKAYQRFAELADAEKGQGDALEAAFFVAQAQYHLERYAEAAQLLTTLANRQDIPVGRRIEARVHQGVCEVELGLLEQAEATLRKALGEYQELPDKDEVSDFVPGQAHFFVGEIYRLRYEEVKLDATKGVDKLSTDFNDKLDLLRSAKGHYLRSMRIRNGHWITASGTRLGEMYEDLYTHIVNAPVPSEFDEEQAEVYRQEVRKHIRALLPNAITTYEETLEAAERLGERNPFVERTRENLRRVQALYLAEMEKDSEEEPPPDPRPKPHS